MFEQIRIEKIQPHPNNPRKDLGDLTELADSIKANGIMQNLTVVPLPASSPDDPAFMVIIGHRRLAAAKLAGLAEVPCAIAEMDEKTQVATMLLENIQRVDLTVLEQAESFQLMFDLGETVETISKKTGFSRATVNHRMNLLSLDKKKFVESSERGATLADYAKLEKIKSVPERNKLLNVIGTSNFNMQYQNAVKDQERKTNKPNVIKAVSAFAKLDKGINYPSNMEYIGHYDFADDVDGIKIPKDAGKREYIYRDNGYGVTVYGKTNRLGKSEKELEEEKDKRKRKRELNAISKQAFILREQFVKEYAGSKKDLPVLQEFLVQSVIFGSDVQRNSFHKAIGAFVEGETYPYTETEKKAAEIIQKRPEKTMLALAWLRCRESKDASYINQYEAKHTSNDSLDRVYKYLVLLGYEMSDDEKALQDGSHALFPQPARKKQKECTAAELPKEVKTDAD